MGPRLYRYFNPKASTLHDCLTLSADREERRVDAFFRSLTILYLFLFHFFQFILSLSKHSLLYFLFFQFILSFAKRSSLIWTCTGISRRSPIDIQYISFTIVVHHLSFACCCSVHIICYYCCSLHIIYYCCSSLIIYYCCLSLIIYY